MKEVPIILFVDYAKLHGEIRFSEPEKAQKILGQHYSNQTDVFIPFVKTYNRLTKEPVTQCVEVNAVEGWALRRIVKGKKLMERVEMPLVCVVELTAKPVPIQKVIQ